MKRYIAEADIGSVLIGNDDWKFSVLAGDDGEMYITVYDKENESDMWRELEQNGFEFCGDASGVFSVYNYDCGGKPIVTLSGEWHVFVGRGARTNDFEHRNAVCFVNADPATSKIVTRRKK